MASGTSRSAAKRTTKKAAEAEAGSEEAAAASKPELVDATRYDFERLESVVTDLVLRHRALQDENSALREQIAGGLAREQQLEAELADLRARRERSRARLDKVLDDLVSRTNLFKFCSTYFSFSIFTIVASFSAARTILNLVPYIVLEKNLLIVEI